MAFCTTGCRTLGAEGSHWLIGAQGLDRGRIEGVARLRWAQPNGTVIGCWGRSDHHLNQREPRAGASERRGPARG